MTGDRYTRDRAAATLESRGVTRRMVRRLAASGRKGEGARTIVGALIESGTTKYLRSLAQTLPEGEEREILRRLLLEEHHEPAEEAEPAMIIAPVKAAPAEAASVRVKPTGADPPGVLKEAEQAGAEASDPEQGDWGQGGARADEG
jgi:hypothetical protein